MREAQFYAVEVFVEPHLGHFGVTNPLFPQLRHFFANFHSPLARFSITLLDCSRASSTVGMGAFSFDCSRAFCFRYAEMFATD
jgi:hypothetical protein